LPKASAPTTSVSKILSHPDRIYAEVGCGMKIGSKVSTAQLVPTIRLERMTYRLQGGSHGIQEDPTASSSH